MKTSRTLWRWAAVVICAVTAMTGLVGCGGGDGGVEIPSTLLGRYSGNVAFSNGNSIPVTVGINSDGSISLQTAGVTTGDTIQGTGRIDLSERRITINGTYFSESIGQTLPFTLTGQLNNQNGVVGGTGTIQLGNNISGTLTLTKIS